MKSLMWFVFYKNAFHLSIALEVVHDKNTQKTENNRQENIRLLLLLLKSLIRRLVVDGNPLFNLLKLKKIG